MIQLNSKKLYSDINDFIAKNPKINSLIRTIQENDSMKNKLNYQKIDQQKTKL